MALRDDDLWEQRIIEAAYLYGHQRLQQADIAKHFRCSQSQVSRMLKQASAKGWLKTEIRFVEDGIPIEIREKLHRLLEPEDLLKGLEKVAKDNKVGVPRLRVFDSGSEATDREDYTLRLEKFSRVAARRIEDILRHATTIGITWGETLHYLINGLASVSPFPRQGFSSKVIAPLCGEVRSVGYPIDYSSTTLANHLQQVMNIDRDAEQLSLTGVPAFISRWFPESKKDVLKEYVQETASYRRIFEGDDALAGRLDVILTSIGSAESSFASKSNAEILKAGKIEVEDLERVLIGDLGGVLIPKPELESEDRDLVKELNEMWTGIKLQDLKRIAKVASTSDGGGIVVVAIGKQKAAVLYETIRLGLVNEALIDQDLANKLRRIMAD
jgi:DNA-binding transcriptional regulator LsrR (DeoR family)